MKTGSIVMKSIVVSVVVLLSLPAMAGMVGFEDFNGGVDGVGLDTDGWVGLFGGDPTTLQYNTFIGRETAKITDAGTGQNIKSIAGYSITDADEDVYMRTIMLVGNQLVRSGLEAVNQHPIGAGVQPGQNITALTVGGTALTADAGYGTVIAYKYYELVLQMKNINHGNSGSLYVRNLSDGETAFTLLSFGGSTTFDMNFDAASKPSTTGQFYIRGQYNGWVDEMEVGTGVYAIPEPATLGMVALMGGGMLWVRKRSSM